MCPLALLSASVAAWFPLPLQVKSASVGGAAVRPFVRSYVSNVQGNWVSGGRREEEAVAVRERQREREGRSEMCGNLHFGGRKEGRKERSQRACSMVFFHWDYDVPG